MEKREFLSALEQSLSVLQEDERKDIISEYEQHIDIKVEKGLTEEEAIADFGSVSQLTSEILEAYHVRADYGAERADPDKRAIPGRPDGGRKQEAKVLLHRIKEFFFRSAERLRWLGNRILEPFRWLWRRGRSLMRRSGEKRRTGRVTEMLGKIRERRGDGHMTGNAIGRGIRAAVRWGLGMVRLAGRLAWNGCWTAFSLTAFGFGLFSLYLFGVLVILLMQGYPLTGVLLGCMGLVMCTFSAGVLGMSFRVKRRRRDGEEEEHA